MRSNFSQQQEALGLRLRALVSIIIAGFFLFSTSCQDKQIKRGQQEKGYADITVYELMQKIEKNEKFVLLDVRAADEYVQGHIKGTLLIPYTEIEERYRELGCPCREIIVYCRSGHRSVIASNSLAKLGFGRVKNLLGGIEAWKKAGAKVMKGELIKDGERAQ
ncbi:MAG: rhodanese-like domain-containing protein [Dehalococcoidia bacterium]|nr:MAG: rhodanese-like domain-containing protein [Dehalococcoidia bacterium]